MHFILNSGVSRSTRSLIQVGTMMSLVFSLLACGGGTGGSTSGGPANNSAESNDSVSVLNFNTSPPTRDPLSPGYPTAVQLLDGSLPKATENGNFIVGPTRNIPAESAAQASVPKGTTFSFQMRSVDSKLYPGIKRDEDINTAPTDPSDTSNLLLTTVGPAAYTRTVIVYIPPGYVPGSEVPFIVSGDGALGLERLLFTVLDNLIAQKRVPSMVAVSIGSGGGDAQGSQRGLEYDTVSNKYTQFVETEVLPLVEQKYNVKLTKDPEGRATMGYSSSGAAAFTMAWFHPELYRRVLAFSMTAVSQQWPKDPALPRGAWEYHQTLIPNSPTKPIRVWLQVGDRDLYNPNPKVISDWHDWTRANQNMAKVLGRKGYQHQFLFVKNAAHVDQPARAQTMPLALEYLWQGYPVK